MVLHFHHFLSLFVIIFYNGSYDGLLLELKIWERKMYMNIFGYFSALALFKGLNLYTVERKAASAPIITNSAMMTQIKVLLSPVFRPALEPRRKT